jgi:uncharacterized membrane protein
MKILLLGEMEFTSGYLKTVCEIKNWQVDIIYSNMVPERIDSSYDLFILSDYPYSRLGVEFDIQIVNHVKNGKGLVMIGGWSSFTGKDGNYGHAEIGKILPVKCLKKDDRINNYSGLHLEPKEFHEIINDLVWDKPPVICGFNKVIPRNESTIILQAKPVIVSDLVFEYIPILVVNQYYKGRVSAFTSDLVPHWCGGLVDWGDEFIKYNGYELGNLYIRFVSQLFIWSAAL